MQKSKQWSGKRALQTATCMLDSQNLWGGETGWSGWSQSLHNSSLPLCLFSHQDTDLPMTLEVEREASRAKASWATQEEVPKKGSLQWVKPKLNYIAGILVVSNTLLMFLGNPSPACAFHLGETLKTWRWRLMMRMFFGISNHKNLRFGSKGIARELPWVAMGVAPSTAKCPAPEEIGDTTKAILAERGWKTLSAVQLCSLNGCQYPIQQELLQTIGRSQICCIQILSLNLGLNVRWHMSACKLAFSIKDKE